MSSNALQKVAVSMFLLSPLAPVCAQDMVEAQSQPASPAQRNDTPPAVLAEPVDDSMSGTDDSSPVPVASGQTAAAELLDTIPVDGPETADGAPPAEAASGNRFIEEVVVTAQKREERLQDVPISISAFSEDRLQASGVESTRDLQLVTPGLSITTSAGYSILYLRGIGTSAFLSSFDPSVATYVDGLYIPGQQAVLTDLGGIERVEVLKGPQGTLFGRNSTGGAISVITKSPGNVAEYSASVETGNYDQMKGKLYLSQPITDTLAGSISAIYSMMDPYYKIVDEPGDIYPPQDGQLGKDKTTGGRVKLRWRPTDDLDFTVSAYRFNQESSQEALAPLVYPSVLSTLLGIRPADGQYESNVNSIPGSKATTTTFSGNAVWNLPWFDVKFIYGHQDIHGKKFAYDFDGGQPNLVVFSSFNIPSVLQTGELQFVSNNEGWTPDWLTWVGGLYYLHQKSGYDPFVLTVAGDGTQSPDGALLGLISQDTLNAINQGLPLPPGIPLLPGPGVTVLTRGLLLTESYSGFVQTTAELTDWVSLTLGGRYQQESRSLPTIDVGLPATGEDGYVPLLPFDLPTKTDKNFSPKASLNFKPWDDALLYVTWSRGYKSGTYNTLSVYKAPDYVKPEIVTSYEVGAKTEFLDGNLRFNTAIFNTTIDDLQTLTVSLLQGGVLSAENAASARSRGAEFDLLWVPLSNWNPGFVVTGGASYLDATYTHYPDATGFNEETGVVFTNGNFSGNRIARTPKFSGSVTLSQTIDLSNGTIEFAGDWYYNSGFYFTAQNAEATKQSAYSLFNARVSYLYQPWNTRVTAFGQNLSDEAYSGSELTTDFGSAQRLAPPRLYGLRLEWEF